MRNSQDSGIENRPEEIQKADLNEVKFEAVNGKGDEDKKKGKEDDLSVEIKDGSEGGRVPSIWRTLAHCLGSTFLFAASMKFFHDALLFVNPYLLR